MAATQAELLGSITTKCGLLAERCRKLSGENGELRRRLAALERELEECGQRLRRAEKDLEMMRMASAMETGSRDISPACSKAISDMVRKIDRCISRLENN